MISRAVVDVRVGEIFNKKSFGPELQGVLFSVVLVTMSFFLSEMYIYSSKVFQFPAGTISYFEYLCLGLLLALIGTPFSHFSTLLITRNVSNVLFEWICLVMVLAVAQWRKMWDWEENLGLARVALFVLICAGNAVLAWTAVRAVFIQGIAMFNMNKVYYVVSLVPLMYLPFVFDIDPVNMKLMGDSDSIEAGQEIRFTPARDMTIYAWIAFALVWIFAINKAVIQYSLRGAERIYDKIQHKTFKTREIDAVSVAMITPFRDLCKIGLMVNLPAALLLICLMLLPHGARFSGLFGETKERLNWDTTRVLSQYAVNSIGIGSAFGAAAGLLVNTVNTLAGKA